jgi:hypothetical protein
MADFVGSVACPWRPDGMPRCPPSPGSEGRADRPARQQEEAGMRQYEQDWLELGFRVAKAMHYQARWARSYLEQAAIEAEGAAEQ